MTFRRIDSYATENAEKLADQLSRLEDNISNALAIVPERLTFSDWVSSGSTTQLVFGKVVRLDTTVSALRVTLPSVSAETAGRIVGVKLKGTNSATVQPVESTALIDGASSVTLAAAGLYLYTHDGQEWSRY